MVLVNEWSASSAEIVASAIKDLQAGILVGNTTFGKGLVQDVIPLPTGGALYLTVATYLTAGGHSIHQTGIRPHVVVTLPEAAGAASIPPDLQTRQRIDHLQTEQRSRSSEPHWSRQSGGLTSWLSLFTRVTKFDHKSFVAR